jgi:hypothetical protein
MSATIVDQGLLAALQGRGMVSTHPVIVVAATGNVPAYCWPMPRDPHPSTGFRIGADFGVRLAEAWKLNEAVHDGAVLTLREDLHTPYLAAGWSFRLGPPPASTPAALNRGSAYNSALAMSVVSGVDAVFLKSGEILTVFVDGAISLEV